MTSRIQKFIEDYRTYLKNQGYSERMIKAVLEQDATDRENREQQRQADRWTEIGFNEDK